MTKIIKMVAVVFCVAALATLSSCSKESELTGTKWKCTYNDTGYSLYSENQFVGTVWEFSNKKGYDDDGYLLYINGVEVGSYVVDSYYEGYMIVDLAIENNEYQDFVEHLLNSVLLVKGNTMEDENHIATWDKM